MEPIAKKTIPDRRTCPHCNQSVSFKTFKIHQLLFYNPALNIWYQSRQFPDDVHVESSSASDDRDSEPSSVDLNDLIHHDHNVSSRDISPVRNLSAGEEVQELSEERVYHPAISKLSAGDVAFISRSVSTGI